MTALSHDALFWLAALALTAAVMLALTLPFLRRPGKALLRAEYDLAIFRDQMRELEEDIAQGLIGEAEAEQARNEIARRILAAGEQRRKAAEQLRDHERGRFAGALPVLAALVVVPALSVAVYLKAGRPGMPDLPIANRIDKSPQARDIAALVRKVEQRLRENPKDRRGWLVLAPVYARQGQYAKAASAYKNAIRLSDKPDADLYNAYGEALVFAARGRFSPEARRAFAMALKLAPGNPMSRFYLAMAAAQDGDNKKAVAELNRLLADLPPDFAGRKAIERQIARLGGAPRTSTPASSSNGGPSAEQVRQRMKDIATMSPQERQRMIRSMVERLENRLADDPADLQGWLRLIRAWSVLGEKDKARAALNKARAAFAGKAEAEKSLADLAARLRL